MTQPASTSAAAEPGSPARTQLKALTDRAVPQFGDANLVLRAALASALAWWVAADLLDLSAPDLAPVGAMLACQLTPYGTARRAFHRGAGVAFGGALGLTASMTVGVTPLTMFATVLVGMCAGRLLRLGGQVHQIALTAVLVMGVPGHFDYGVHRLAANLLGVAIGAAVGLAVPPPPFARRASEKLAHLSGQMSELLNEMSEQLRDGNWDAHSGEWVERARALSERLTKVRTAVAAAEDANRWRPHTRDATLRVERLIESTRCLDHVGHQIRGIARGLYNLTYREGRPPALHWSHEDRALRPEPTRTPEGLDQLLADLASTLAVLAEPRLLHDSPTPQLRERLRSLLGAAETSFLTCALTQQAAYADWRELCTAGILEDARKVLHELDPQLGPHQRAFRD
ncbi:FUSC family protein [Streptomyces sp. TRM66268-LWL]|uniref:FUSC family protein n=1 Tax=Streptomyces polyasparticus TaxID=2767826 RepID=A0ABR7SDP3_9ACTN|nr:FUSC family protein [Streptomyces polyasparticus]MBC9713299.1 FUSC family protein [Streptomyces polyasparticus]